MQILESFLSGLRTVCAGFTDARRSTTCEADTVRPKLRLTVQEYRGWPDTAWDLKTPSPLMLKFKDSRTSYGIAEGAMPR